MAENLIKRKELWRGLGNTRGRDWIHAADELGLNVTQPKGGSSHYAIRLPGFEKEDIKGLISNVHDKMRKDISEKVFKRLIKKGGCAEDDIWRALGMLK